jgi:hypothetical protein
MAKDGAQMAPIDRRVRLWACVVARQGSTALGTCEDK